MPSDRMLRRREAELELAPRIYVRTPGAGYELVNGVPVCVRRKNRLAIEAKTLTRAERKDLKRLRAKRRFTGIEQPQPPWAQKYEEQSKTNTDVLGLVARIQQDMATEEQQHADRDDAGRGSTADDTDRNAGDGADEDARGPDGW